MLGLFDQVKDEFVPATVKDVVCILVLIHCATGHLQELGAKSGGVDGCDLAVLQLQDGPLLQFPVVSEELFGRFELHRILVVLRDVHAVFEVVTDGDVRQ